MGRWWSECAIQRGVSRAAGWWAVLEEPSTLVATNGVGVIGRKLARELALKRAGFCLVWSICGVSRAGSLDVHERRGCKSTAMYSTRHRATSGQSIAWHTAFKQHRGFRWRQQPTPMWRPSSAPTVATTGYCCVRWWPHAATTAQTERLHYKNTMMWPQAQRAAQTAGPQAAAASRPAATATQVRPQ